MPLINCEIELGLSWAKDYILIQHHDNIAGVNFVITSTKLYFPVVTLSINDNIKFLENIKQAFNRTISWNKYRSEITTQPKNNHLDYLIDPTFRNINRLFVLSFKNGSNDPARDSFEKYYMSLVEIKYSNALIDNKPFFGQPVKNKQQAYEKLRNLKKKWLYNWKYIRLFVPSKVWYTHWFRFIKINKYKYSTKKLVLQENWRKIMVQR